MKFKDFLNSKLNEQWSRGDDDEPREDDDRGWFGRKKKKKKEDEEGETKKPVKTFNVGDVITLADTKKSTKIPEDAWDFLMTYKTFTVRKVNEKGKIDLGCHISKNTPEGGVEKIYMFSPERFALQTPAPIKEPVAGSSPDIEIGQEISDIDETENDVRSNPLNVKKARIFDDDFSLIDHPDQGG